MNERVARIAVAAVLVLAGLWLAFAAAGGGTSANAGRVQFYQGPICRFSGPNPPDSGCPRRPVHRAPAATASAAKAQPQRR